MIFYLCCYSAQMTLEASQNVKYGWGRVAVTNSHRQGISGLNSIPASVIRAKPKYLGYNCRLPACHINCGEISIGSRSLPQYPKSYKIESE